MDMDTRRFLLHVLLGTAATLAIFLTSLQLPFLGVGMIILTPLPVMTLCHRWGLWGGALTVVIGSLVISMVASPVIGIVFCSEFGLMGIFLHHYMVRRRLPWDRGILLSSLIVLGMVAILVIVLKTATSSTVVEWSKGEINEAGSSLFQLYSTENTENQAVWIDYKKLTTFVLRILPALMILSIWLEGLVNAFLFARITNRIAQSNDRFVMRPELSAWICPDWLIWAGILGGFLIVTKISFLVTIGLNTVILLLAIYFLQGIAIISFFFKKRNVPLGFRVMGYALIGIIQLLLLAVAALGVFDIWIDFRKLRPKLAAPKKSA